MSLCASRIGSGISSADSSRGVAEHDALVAGALVAALARSLRVTPCEISFDCLVISEMIFSVVSQKGSVGSV